MYRLWLNGLYELYGPRCPLFSKRPINLISLSLSLQVLAELDEEKKKHALDTAQGDDVTYMLEKERERLKQEVQYLKQWNRVCGPGSN